LLKGKEDEEEKGEEKTMKKKKPSMKKYGTGREVVVLRGTKGLEKFCTDLVAATKEFAARHKDNPKACAIGLDVEYCSLELDIRMLPAAMQLSAPGRKGPVGVLWLDKFPNHGRDMLSDKKCAPLLSLLADSTLQKVGVGVSKDAKNLASWWGVDDKKYINHFITNMIDLENELDENVNQKSLQEMSALVLQRNLPKLKQRGRKREKRSRKKITAHWRKDELSPQMREYAVNDAACSIDVWLHINGLVGGAKQEFQRKAGGKM
jgi:hypothetical protein